jgi:hypothetical protein
MSTDETGNPSPPSRADWIDMADSILNATRTAYAVTHMRDWDFDKLGPGGKADALAAIKSANAFYLSMARLTADALALAE